MKKNNSSIGSYEFLPFDKEKILLEINPKGIPGISRIIIK